jgi:hypothetical protein
MYEVLDKDTIKNEIIPYLSVAKLGQTHLNELVFSTNIHYSIRHQASYLSHFSFSIARV